MRKYLRNTSLVLSGSVLTVALVLGAAKVSAFFETPEEQRIAELTKEQQQLQVTLSSLKKKRAGEIIQLTKTEEQMATVRSRIAEIEADLIDAINEPVPEEYRDDGYVLFQKGSSTMMDTSELPSSLQ